MGSAKGKAEAGANAALRSGEWKKKEVKPLVIVQKLQPTYHTCDGSEGQNT